MDKQLESSNRDKVLRRVARRLRPLGFERTKPTFFTRLGAHVIEFVHLHKFTFGPTFRVHLGIRVTNDALDACALNGPAESNGFAYGLTEDSLEACAASVRAYVEAVGEPWFASWRDLDRLLSSPDTPLRGLSLESLRDSMTSGTDPVRATRSHDLLGTAQRAPAADGASRRG